MVFKSKTGKHHLVWPPAGSQDKSWLWLTRYDKWPLSWGCQWDGGTKGECGWIKPFAFQLRCRKNLFISLFEIHDLEKSADTAMHNHMYIPVVWKQPNLSLVIATINSDNTRWHRPAKGVSADTAEAIKLISSEDASEAGERAATHQGSNLLLSSPSFHHLPPLPWLVAFV